MVEEVRKSSKEDKMKRIGLGIVCGIGLIFGLGIFHLEFLENYSLEIIGINDALVEKKNRRIS